MSADPDPKPAVVILEYLRRQRAYGRAPGPWQANGFSLEEIRARLALQTPEGK
jgi:hypothetical protein